MENAVSDIIKVKWKLFLQRKSTAALCGTQGKQPGTPKGKRLPCSHFGPQNDDTGMTKRDTGDVKSNKS